MTTRAIALDGVPDLSLPKPEPDAFVVIEDVPAAPPRRRYGYVGRSNFRWLEEEAGHPLRIFLDGVDVTADCVDFYDGDQVDAIGSGSYANLIIRSQQESGFRRVYGHIELVVQL